MTISMPGIVISYGLLTLALIWLWFPRFCPWRESSPCWQAPVIAALIGAIYFGLIQPIALFWIALLWGMGVSARRVQLTPWRQRALLLVVVVLALAMATHQLPGFFRHPAQGVVQLNFAKAMVGLLLLAYWQPLLRHWREFWPMLKTTSLVALIAIPGVLLLALALGYVQYRGLPMPLSFAHLLLWMWGNLFLTVLAEEAFFRGLIQARLAAYWSGRPYGTAAALIIAALLFGLAHIVAGSWGFVLLATLAGLAYGLVYQLTQRIEASIVLHFSLNLVYWLFFTSPTVIVFTFS